MRFRPFFPLFIVLLGAVLAYWPSLAGGFVWDERALLVAPPDLFTYVSSPHGFFWRPLTAFFAWFIHSATMDPLPHRIQTFLVHLLAMVSIAGCIRSLGAGWHSAALGAGFFGLHTAVSECVAWSGGRSESIPSLALFVGWWALFSGRPWLAGAALALAPFGKESFLLAPLTLVVFAWSRLGWSWRAFGVAVVGCLGWLSLRMQVLGTFPVAAATGDPIGGVGATGMRLIELLFVPLSANAFYPFVSMPGAGVAWGLLGVVAFVASRRFQPLAFVACGLLMLIPNASAMHFTGLVSDRYYYVTFGCLGILAGLAAERESRFRLGLAGLCVLLVGSSWVRSSDWLSSKRLAEASLLLDPDNRVAAFHLGAALHLDDGDCPSAIPYYQAAIEVDPRVTTNLLACLVDGNQPQEAANVADSYPPATPSGHANAARAYAQVGRLEDAVGQARTATSLAPDKASHHMLLGNLHGMRGELLQARSSFEQVLVLNNESVEAQAALARLRAMEEGE